MIVYVDSKTKKVDLTRDQLEKLLEEEYNRGYNAGRVASGHLPTYIYNNSCPYGYWNCPYRTITTSTPEITWTSNSNTTPEFTTYSGSSDIKTAYINSSTSHPNVTYACYTGSDKNG